MRAGVCTVQQALTAEAASMVKQALGLARRRGHAQVTPLHVASAMLATTTGLLRRACLQSHSHPLQFRALELCFNVALNRLPASTSSPLLGPHHHHPSLSNALVAAFKRAQAHQRRGSIENQQQPILALKIELEHLIISILDDPSVSRVMREAGFSSTQVKVKVEQTVSMEISSQTPSPKENNPNPQPLGANPNAQTHFEFGFSSSKLLDRESVAVAESVVRGVMDKLEKMQVSGDLRYLQLISFPLFSIKNLGKDEVEQKLLELNCLVKRYMGKGVVLYVGDLKWISEFWSNYGDQGRNHYCPVEHIVMELKDYCDSRSQYRAKESIDSITWSVDEAEVNKNQSSFTDRLFNFDNVVSSSSSLPSWLQSYKEETRTNPSHDNKEALNLSWPVIFESKKSPKEFQFWISKNDPKPELLSNPNSSPNSASSSEAIEGDIDGYNAFKALNAENMNILLNALEKQVPWQKNVIPEIVNTILECRSGMREGKIWLNQRELKEETWLFFLGSDNEAKQRISRELARLVFGSQTSFVSISPSDFGSKRADPNQHNKRKRSDESGNGDHVLSRLAEALNENPHSCESFSSMSRACSSRRRPKGSDTEVMKESETEQDKSQSVSLDLNIAIGDNSEESTTMNDHITSFNQLVTDLMNMDVTFEDEDLALMLMGSLPDEFEYLETTLLHGNVDVSLREVTDALYRHWKKEYPKLKNKGKPEKGKNVSESNVVEYDDTDSDFAFAATPSTSCFSLWLLNSACSHHMTPNREWFFDFKELKGWINQNLNMCPLCTRFNEKSHLCGNLRVKRFRSEGKRWDYEDYLWCTGDNEGNMEKKHVYTFLGSTIVGTSAVAASTDEQESEATRLWHMRLGHVGEKSLKLLIDQGLLKGARACKLAFCEHCIKGKKTRVKFRTSIHDTRGILDYVHSDVWGPSKTTSLGGTHYYVTFVDDFSRRVWVYTMKTKDEVLGFFLKWKNMVGTQTGRKIKRLRTDNDGEYKNDQFLKVCEEEGIVRHFTVRSTPQQNGVAERMNRTLMEKVRCMLSNARLGKEFWPEALVYACHLVNRLPSTTIGGKTPLEKWFGESATDYDSLHVFGSTAYYHIKESKLDPRAKKAIFMGITSGVKDYRLWCPETKKIIFNRDVTFDESTMLRKVTSEKLEQTDGTPKQVEFEGSRIDPASKETDVDSPMVEEESDEEEVQTQEPPQQHESIALKKGKRTIRQPACFADMNQTWKLASLPKGKKAIGCKWVYAKTDVFPNKNNIRYKARLVAKGYAQTEGVDYNEVFSPVVKHSSIRILLALVAQLDLELVQMDVKTAFLHGDLDEEIYMTQPDGFKVAEKEEMVCKLEKSLYELKQSPRQWEFEMKDLGEAKKILGMKISRDKKLGRLCLSQKEYLRKVLKHFGMNEKSKPVSTPLAPHFKLGASMSPKDDAEREYMSKVPYASAVGSLMYAMVFTRPDISQAVGDKQDGQCVVGYCDSDYAGDLDKRRSPTGYVFTFTKAPVSWESTLQSTVALSTIEAEYMAVTEAVKEAIWLHGFLGELGMEQKHIKVHCDSQSAIHLAKNQVYHARTKHIDVRCHFVREILEEGGVIIQKIRTIENPVDMLTKVVTAVKFKHCLDLVNIVTN
ncbi:Detected protein of unknown function [Hibiscus syriacus]|uniref:Uncharacterized protein n=1 Tax=Hibiscus syriacus TaxID=106335 RepID=A0A6A2Z5D0_HIBSY|nr:Detected protein of unknown function [Hibiscus syriacus]